MLLLRCPQVPQCFAKIMMVRCITVLFITCSLRTPVSSFLSSVYNMLLWCPLQWRHNGCDGVSNHQRFDCMLNYLFRRGSKNTSKLGVIGLCEGNSPVTGELPAHRASYAENVSIWWRHHAKPKCFVWTCKLTLNLLQRLPCGNRGCYSEMSLQFARSSKTSEAYRVV